MKNLISIFLCVLLFLGGIFRNDMEEVYKLPALFKHYYEHQSTAVGDFNFIDFLYLHYLTDHAHSDHKSDLPLYKHGFPPLTFVLFSSVKVEEQKLPKIITHSFIYNFSLSEASTSSCLKPPRA